MEAIEFKALKCDVCSGNLVMDDSREFATCEYCETKYTINTLRAKIQEIKGTVRIDGPVETVKGNSEKERTASNVESFFKIKRFDEAKKVIEYLITQFPNDFRGWWYRFILPFEEYKCNYSSSSHCDIVDYKTAYQLCENNELFGTYFDGFIRNYGETPHLTSLFTFYDDELNLVKRSNVLDFFTQFIIYDLADIIEILPNNFTEYIKKLSNTVANQVLNGKIAPIGYSSYYSPYVHNCEDRPYFYSGDWYIKNVDVRTVLSLSGSKTKIKESNGSYSKTIILKNKNNHLSLYNNSEGDLLGRWLRVREYDSTDWILLPKLVPMRSIFMKMKRCSYCGGELSGTFSKKCAKCGKLKDY